MVSPVFASAYEAESGLRLLRVSGRWDVQDLLVLAPHDPTIIHAPDSLTIVDLRGLDVTASAGEIEQLASFRRESGDAPFEDRYAWVIDNPKTAGIALLFGRLVGAGRIHRFETVDEALAHFDLTFDAYLRAEEALRPVG